MKTFLNLVALVFAIIAVGSMFGDRWGAGFLFLGLSIFTICLIPEDRPLRHKGSIHFFGK